MEYFCAVINSVDGGYSIREVERIFVNPKTGRMVRREVSNTVLRDIARRAKASTSQVIDRYRVDFEDIYPTRVAKMIGDEFIESREYRSELIELLGIEVF